MIMWKTKMSMLVLCLAACGEDAQTPQDNEVITTVILNFEPAAGAVQSFEFDDADGDGGNAPTVDPIVLAPGDYTLTVQFQNRLETPPEEITEEVNDESSDHLLLFTGNAVVGPATTNTTGPLTQAYADTDANGFPVGLDNDVTATAGTGTLNVTLRHMPPEEPPVKDAGTVAQVKSSGVNAIGGSTDVAVSFSVTVQ